jgi:hypothetical protein
LARRIARRFALCDQRARPLLQERDQRVEVTAASISVLAINSSGRPLRIANTAGSGG